MKFDYNRAAAFTGHRPQKLPFGFDESLPEAKKLRAFIAQEIEYAALCGYIYFLTGMALGTDMIAAEEVLRLKQELYPQISLIAVIPCSGQSDKWSDESKKRYDNIISRASHVIRLSERPYFNGCMQARNRFLVEHSTLLIGVYDGTAGGTRSTIDMAEKRGNAVAIIDPSRFVRIVPVDNDRQLEYYHKTENRCERQLRYLRENKPELLELWAEYSDEYTTPAQRYAASGRLCCLCCEGQFETDFTL